MTTCIIMNCNNIQQDSFGLCAEHEHEATGILLDNNNNVIA